MCWVTLERTAALFVRRGLAGHEALDAVARHIRDDVLEHAWNPRVGAFTATYDGEALDAAALWVGLSGMVPGDDERFAATVRAVEAGLRRGPVVDRYRHDDGLPGREGGFLLCGLWLAEAFVLTGRHADAEDLFAQVCALAGPTGLLAEQYEPRLGLALGNVPQTYSHHGVIDVAVRLDALRRAERADRTAPAGHDVWSRVLARVRRRR